MNFMLKVFFMSYFSLSSVCLVCAFCGSPAFEEFVEFIFSVEFILKLQRRLKCDVMLFLKGEQKIN